MPVAGPGKKFEDGPRDTYVSGASLTCRVEPPPGQPVSGTVVAGAVAEGCGAPAAVVAPPESLQAEHMRAKIASSPTIFDGLVVAAVRSVLVVGVR